jgi:hypothetical protein
MSDDFIKYDHETNLQALSEIEKQINSVHQLREDSDKIITSLENIYGGQAYGALQQHHQQVNSQLDELLQSMNSTKAQAEEMQHENLAMDVAGSHRFG